jgi:TRAP-type C4-dicarboxylate transport system permease small subunit
VGDIVGRQTIGVSVTGLNDITQLLVMGFVSLALPITFLRQQNVTVDLFTDLLPAGVRRWLTAIMGLCTTVFVGALAWYAWVQAASQFREGAGSATLAIPMAYYWVPLLAGISLSALLCAVLVVRQARAGGSQG